MTCIQPNYISLLPRAFLEHFDEIMWILTHNMEQICTPSGAIVKQISSLPSDVHKTKKLSFDEYMNISKGHQILM